MGVTVFRLVYRLREKSLTVTTVCTSLAEVRVRGRLPPEGRVDALTLWLRLMQHWTLANDGYAHLRLLLGDLFAAASASGSRGVGEQVSDSRIVRRVKLRSGYLRRLGALRLHRVQRGLTIKAHLEVLQLLGGIEDGLIRSYVLIYLRVPVVHAANATDRLSRFMCFNPLSLHALINL